MMRIYNLEYQKPIRQRLRNGAPRAEKLLWQKLKHSQLLGCKFRRQHGIANYIVDFYCPEKRLAIEIDGQSHATREAAIRDRVRQSFIEKFGIRFLRFSNEEVYSNIDGVLDSIARNLEQSG